MNIKKKGNKRVKNCGKFSNLSRALKFMSIISRFNHIIWINSFKTRAHSENKNIFHSIWFPTRYMYEEEANTNSRHKQSKINPFSFSHLGNTNKARVQAAEKKTFMITLTMLLPHWCHFIVCCLCHHITARHHHKILK